MEWSDHNQVFLDVAGESVTFIPAGGPEETVTVLVERGQDFEDQHPGYKAAVSGLVSSFSQTPVDGDVIKIGDDVFVVAEPEATGGCGWQRFLLRLSYRT